MLPPPPGLTTLSSTALFLDFDGTLVDIADGPDKIEVGNGLGASLCALAAQIGGRLALISGRALADLEHHLGALNIAMGGSHGGELRRADGGNIGTGVVRLPDNVRDSLKGFAEENSGLLYEEKTLGAALHYRGAPERETGVLAITETLAKRHGLTLKQGKMVAELMPSGYDKGSAVRTFMSEDPFTGAWPVFVGDDVTDEDGFSAARELGGFGVLVGDPRPTAAIYRLASPAAVHDWLNL
ncbi:MAG: trehalose-phosphatase [Pacificimonas sp.]